jgi:hypothetical protein
MAEKKNVYGILLGKTEEEKPHGRLKRSWDVKLKWIGSGPNIVERCGINISGS